MQVVLVFVIFVKTKFVFFYSVFLCQRFQIPVFAGVKFGGGNKLVFCNFQGGAEFLTSGDPASMLPQMERLLKRAQALVMS